ncbi:MAG: site-specific integrase [Planctomycetes bacterium]|nr:site-specific integrase [Planctomycetota bacterium]
MFVSGSSAPKYRLHKGSGQALVQLNGRRIYLGIYGTPESKEKYRRLVAEWLTTRTTPNLNGQPTELAIVELIPRYWQEHVTRHYVPAEQENIRPALRPLRETYGAMKAAQFGPLALKAVRQVMVASGLARTTVNQRVARIRRLFRWAVENELVPAAVCYGLAAVAGLRRGRTEAREPDPVGPVGDATVDGTLPHLPPVVADMVKFQRLVGCRPGEVVILRPSDVDTSGDVWQYKPATHKTAHLGRARVIFIGPKAQDILRRYLLRPHDSYCFAPSDSERRRRRELRARRKSKVQPSQRDRSNRKPQHKPGARYTKDGYNTAIRRACAAAAGLVRPRRPRDAGNEAAMEQYKAALKVHNSQLRKVAWSPNQLRHAVATQVRRQFGLEAAQTVLGHSKADVTQVYAERDFALAARVMREVG